MSPEQFNQLREGDIIRNQNGNGFSVLERRGGVVLAQCVQSVPQSLSGLWTLCARLESAWETLPPPAPATPKRPSESRMRQQILDANGLAIESKDGTKYRIRGRVFDTLESAWDSLPKATCGGKTLQRMREELFKVGWTMDTSSCGAEVKWTSPTGLVKSIEGTRAAWNYVFGDDAP